MKTVSVVIPCYNQGIYIEECLESVKQQTYSDIEIIIVNDGSTDSYTIEKLEEIKKRDESITIINTKNSGLSAARNTGIRNSHGYYILPLDGDDKIEKTYIEKCVRVFETQKNIDVVCCVTEFFGTRKGIFGLRDITIENMLKNNCLTCTSMFRKEDYDNTLGYSEDMKYGLEDWEFWLQMIEQDKKFYRIDEVLFFYRMKEASMIKDMLAQQEKNRNMRLQIYKKHKDLYDRYDIEINPKQTVITKYVSKVITLKQIIKLGYLNKKNKKL